MSVVVQSEESSQCASHKWAIGKYDSFYSSALRSSVLTTWDSYPSKRTAIAHCYTNSLNDKVRVS